MGRVANIHQNLTMVNLMTLFTKSILRPVMSFHITKLIPREITKYLQLMGNNTFKINELDYKKSIILIIFSFQLCWHSDVEASCTKGRRTGSERKWSCRTWRARSARERRTRSRRKWSQSSGQISLGKSAGEYCHGSLREREGGGTNLRRIWTARRRRRTRRRWRTTRSWWKTMR